MLIGIYCVFACNKHPGLDLQWLLSSFFRRKRDQTMIVFSGRIPPFSPLSSSKTHLFSWYLTDTPLPTPFQPYPSHSLSNDDVGYECATALEGEEHLVRGLGKRAPHSYTHHYPCKHSLYRWTLWKHMHTPYCQIIYILLSIPLVKLSFASRMNL